MFRFLRKYRFLATFLIVMFGAFLGAGSGMAVNFSTGQEASFLDSIKSAITAPFRASNENLSPDVTNQNIPLYRPALDYERAVIEAVKKTAPAVVSIAISKQVPIIESCRREDPFSGLPPEFRELFNDGFSFSVPCQTGTRLEEVGGGSGFIISSDGLVLTNKHVVADRDASYTVFTNDGNKYDASVLARDPSQDLAILKIGAMGLPAVELGDSDSIELGQTAIAIGNALAEFRNTVSVGVISGLSRTITAGGPGVPAETISGLIQSDAAINIGNSGGPLINLRGEVIGINTAVASGAQNIGFAIPINDAKRDIDSVKASGEIQVPYIGVRYIMLSASIADQEGLPISRGAWVVSSGDTPAVISDSPADKAGIKEGDIITRINNIRVTRQKPLADIISRLAIGEVAEIVVFRGSEEVIFTVVLDKRPSE